MVLLFVLIVTRNLLVLFTLKSDFSRVKFLIFLHSVFFVKKMTSSTIEQQTKKFKEILISFNSEARSFLLRFPSGKFLLETNSQ